MPAKAGALAEVPATPENDGELLAHELRRQSRYGL